MLVVDAEPRNLEDAGAGGDDHGIPFDHGLCAVVGAHEDFLRALHLGRAAKHVDLERLAGLGESAPEHGSHAFLAGVHGSHVHFGALALDAVFGKALGEGEGVRAGAQGLGRNAAPVEAGAAQILALDERDVAAFFRGLERGGVAAGAASDDGQLHGDPP